MSRIADEPARLLLEPGAVEWVPAAELTRGARVGCIDGRTRCGAVGAPGGSTGELVLALAVGEWLRGRDYLPAEVERLAAAFADRIGGLYLHSDAGAHAALATHLGLEPDRFDPSRPPPALRARLLDAVARPEHIGCGHLRSIALEPQAYRVRPALLALVLAAVHRLSWVRDDVIIDVLAGDHEETALAVFHTRHPVTGETPLPSLREPYRARFLVENIAAVRHLRLRIGALLRSLDPELAAADAAVLDPELERLGERHLTLTAARLGPTLPRYRVTFDGLRRALELGGT